MSDGNDSTKTRFELDSPYRDSHVDRADCYLV